MEDIEVHIKRLSREHHWRQERRYWRQYMPQYVAPEVNPYKRYYEERIRYINDILEQYLRVRLHCTDQYFGETLIYNDDEGPIWQLRKNQHGKEETKRAINALREAERILEEEEAYLRNQLKTDDISHFRRNLTAFLKDIPAPGKLMFDVDLFRASRHKLKRLVSAYKAELERQAPRQFRGNDLAYRSALALRAVYEHYRKEPVTCGKDRSSGVTVVTGIYCRCLAEIYEVIGVEAEVYSKASWAKNRPEDDPVLRHYRQCLVENSPYNEEHLRLFREVGWVENMTPE